MISCKQTHQSEQIKGTVREPRVTDHWWQMSRYDMMGHQATMGREERYEFEGSVWFYIAPPRSGCVITPPLRAVMERNSTVCELPMGEPLNKLIINPYELVQ